MILEAICSGNFSPIDRIYPEDPEYRSANQSVCELLDVLSTHLSKEDFHILEDLLSHSAMAHCLENEAYFRMGFATGMAVHQEVQDALQTLTADP